MKDLQSSRDDFWDIQKLVPKKSSASIGSFSYPKITEHKIEGEEKESCETFKIKTEITGRTECAEIKSYTPSGNGLIKKVSVIRRADKYDFYDNFRKAAKVYFDLKTDKCDFVPYYSYMPQYSQFNSQQKNFYFYWRDCVRRGKYINTDYSYFYLYVYEILNLPDKISPQDGMDMLIAVWRAYRKDLPKIDSYMSLWLQDYCFIYNLPCPADRIGDFIFDVIGVSEFKEFYLSEAMWTGEGGVASMIAYLSDYDWSKGKYAGGDNKEAYSQHLLGAMGRLVNHLWTSGAIIDSIETARFTRSAFKNSLCTHSVKCQLDIEYIPISKALELRSAVTSALRYTENKLRALLGVKSRLAIKNLPDEYKSIIDGYFTGLFDKINHARQVASIPEYERLYDAEKT